MRLGGVWAALLAGLGLATGAARAGEYAWGGKLDLTRGVTQVEGAGGGGLASWALITGNETDDGVGGEANGAYVPLPNFSLRTYGAGLGFNDRLELTYEGQDFDTGATGARLGLGKGFTFHQDVLGAKLRLVGDAVYDQDRWLPQIALGAQYKHNSQGAVIHAVGGRDAEGVDVYLAATKLLLNQNLVLDATMRMTRANQFGLLGFGGDLGNGYSPQFEGSAGYLVNRRLLVGAEYRTKPSHLGFARETDAYDVFAALAVCKTLSVVLAYVDLGEIATLPRQRGVYVSLQAGF
jgi:hypothetical protein